MDGNSGGLFAEGGNWLLRRFFSGGTECPKCGAAVCSASRRLVKRRCHCPSCGAPCETPLRVYGIAAAAALAGGAAYALATAESGWQQNGKWLFSCLCAVFLLYEGVGIVAAGLVPLRYREGEEWDSPTPPLEYFFSCTAEAVYRAAHTALRRADSYEVTELRPEQGLLWVSKSSNAAVRNRWQQHEPGLNIALLTENMGDGSCRLALTVEPKRGGLEQWQRQQELKRIVKLIQTELEFFPGQTAKRDGN